MEDTDKTAETSDGWPVKEFVKTKLRDLRGRIRIVHFLWRRVKLLNLLLNLGLWSGRSLDYRFSGKINGFFWLFVLLFHFFLNLIYGNHIFCYRFSVLFYDFIFFVCLRLCRFWYTVVGPFSMSRLTRKGDTKKSALFLPPKSTVGELSENIDEYGLSRHQRCFFWVLCRSSATSQKGIERLIWLRLKRKWLNALLIIASDGEGHALELRSWS